MEAGKEDPCRFGAGRLKPRIKAFIAEIDGVREGTDSECVHRMRVAARRLRSALPLFSGCFDPVQYRRWMKAIRAVARALGRARDTDVQLQFLDRYERERSGSPAASAITAKIRSFLRKDRKDEQVKVISALVALEKKGVLPALLAAARNAGRGKTSGRANRRQERPVSVLAKAGIRDALCDLLSYGRAVHDPADISGHHALRISAKKLRYTLEVFRPLYPDRLRPALAGIKRLQELLGRLHDCDVWIRRLSDRTEGKDSGPAPGEILRAISPLSPDEEAGVAALLEDRAAARRELYGQLVAEWETAVAGPLAAYLSPLAGISPGDAVSTGEKACAAVPGPADSPGALAGLNPGMEGHARQVTRLALLLFDELKSLHRRGKKDRRLLEYAGLLHDIGWSGGQKGHHTRSGRMILSDRTLPVTSRERTMIALVARFHRKPVPERPGRLFSSLEPGAGKRVLMLASLLRIADGLDYTHADRVTSLACTIDAGTVTCTVTCDGDGSTERARALAKADLFERVFRRRFVLP